MMQPVDVWRGRVTADSFGAACVAVEALHPDAMRVCLREVAPDVWEYNAVHLTMRSIL